MHLYRQHGYGRVSIINRIGPYTDKLAECEPELPDYFLAAPVGHSIFVFGWYENRDFMSLDGYYRRMTITERIRYTLTGCPWNYRNWGENIY